MARRYSRGGRKAPTAQKAPKTHRYRSVLEKNIGDRLDEQGANYGYEILKVPYIQHRTYHADWVLLDNGIVVESKGRFTSQDRTKHKDIKRQHPDLDLRFVFQRSTTKISTLSTLTYADWCRDFGFKYADKFIPQAWLRESPNEKSLAAIWSLMGSIDTP